MCGGIKMRYDLNKKRRIVFIFLIILCVTLCACGRKGPLIPPEALVPAAISDLKVAQQGELFRISWSRPAREEGGGPLRDLAGFQLFKREVLPPAEDCEECPSAYRLLKAVDLDYLQEVRRSGDLFLLSDAELRQGKTYQYKAVSLKRDGTPSRESNRARRKKVEPPLPPVLQTNSTPTGVLLEFVAIPFPEGGVIQGYNVYRRRQGEPMPLRPLNAAPVSGNTYEDLHPERGTVYSYAVRTVALVDGESVESISSNEMEGALTAPD
jgi:predicted small lipoprotein YifL